MKPESIGRILKIVGGAVPFSILMWLLFLYSAPTGAVEFERRVDDDVNIISELGPKERVGNLEEDRDRQVIQRRLLAEPVYFDVASLRKFDRATVSVEFENMAQPIMELGLQIGLDPRAVSFKPLHNRFIEQLTWNRLEDPARKIILLQRPINPTTGIGPRQFSTIDEFLNHGFTIERVAEYGVNIGKQYRIPGFSETPRRTTIDTPLRGPHTMWTYVKDGSLDIHVDVIDLNRASGSDRVVVDLLNGSDEPISQTVLEDDGDETTGGKPSAQRAIDISLSDLPEGIVKVKIQGSDDILLRRIETGQDILLFEKRVFLAGNEEYRRSVPDLFVAPVTLYTDSSKMQALTSHSSGLQTIRAGATDIALDATGVTKDMIFPINDSRDRTLIAIQSPKGDVLLTADNFMVFEKDQYVQPDASLFPLQAKTLESEFDYLVSKGYTPAVKEKFWSVGTATFDLANAFVQDQKIRFVISAPELTTRPGSVKVHSVKVRFEGRPVTFGDLIARLKRLLS